MSKLPLCRPFGSHQALGRAFWFVTALLLFQPLSSQELDQSFDLRLSGNGKETYLELDEAIAAALRSNIEIKIESIAPQLEANRTLQAVGEFDPAFESRFRYDNLDTPQTSQEFLGTGGDRFANGNLLRRNRVFAEDNFEMKTGIVGKLRSGTEYDVGVRNNRFINDLTRDPTVGRFNPEYRSFTGITFLQPLLQNFGREVNESKIIVSRQNRFIADQVFRQKLTGIVKNVIAAYYDAFLAYEDAILKRFEVEVLRRMASEKRDQLERGTITERDLGAVKNSLSESYERFLLSRQTLLTKNGDLLMLLQQEVKFEGYPVFLPIDPPGRKLPDLDPQCIAAAAMEMRPEYLMALENVEKLGMILKYRKNQLLPRVDIEGTIGFSGLSGSFGSALGNSYEGQGHEYGLGILINKPLGNTTQKALYAETENQRCQALMKVKQEELETCILINRHIMSAKTHEKRLQAASMSTRIQQESLEAAKGNLEKGTITESTLMKVERDVSETRLREFAAAADMQKSLADLWETNGSLLDRYGVKIQCNCPNSPVSVTTGQISGGREHFSSSEPVEEDEPFVSVAPFIKESSQAKITKRPSTGKPGNNFKKLFARTSREVPASIEENKSPLIVAIPVAVQSIPVSEAAAPLIVSEPVKPKDPSKGQRRFFRKK